MLTVANNLAEISYQIVREFEALFRIVSKLTKCVVTKMCSSKFGFCKYFYTWGASSYIKGILSTSVNLSDIIKLLVRVQNA